MTKTAIPDSYRTRHEIEEIVVIERLHLYNQGVPCGAQAIRNILWEQCVRPLPSISTIKRILSRNYLTHGRTGYYPEDDGAEVSHDSSPNAHDQAIAPGHPRG